MDNIGENEKKEQIELYLQGKGMKREIWKTLDKKEQKELRKSIKKSNFEKASKEMDKIFEEKNIDRESYKEIYGITLKNFMRQEKYQAVSSGERAGLLKRKFLPPD